MCIICAIPKTKKLSKETAQNCFRVNSHGAGFAYVEDGQVKIQKGFTEFDKFWEAFEPIQEANEEAKLVHFRVCSAGIVDEYNMHPFFINENHALVHNGTLSSFKNPKLQVSDTVLFNHNILKPLFEQFPTFYKTKVGSFIIEEMIGSGNKLGILDAEGEITIFNESAGEWVDDIWFSNKSYLPPPPPKKKEENFYGKRHKGTKKQKPCGYRAVEDILIEEKENGVEIVIEKGHQITTKEISELTHYYRKKWKQKCKLKTLVYKQILEPIFDNNLKV